MQTSRLVGKCLHNISHFNTSLVGKGTHFSTAQQEDVEEFVLNGNTVLENKMTVIHEHGQENKVQHFPMMETGWKEGFSAW